MRIVIELRRDAYPRWCQQPVQASPPAEQLQRPHAWPLVQREPILTHPARQRRCFLAFRVKTIERRTAAYLLRKAEETRHILLGPVAGNLINSTSDHRPEFARGRCGHSASATADRHGSVKSSPTAICRSQLRRLTALEPDKIR